ncbi:hypothetical protein BBJ28_00019690, partial [Nothophytophthora sp. Chile5]
AILHESGEVTKPMIKFGADVPKESVMDVFVTLTVSDGLVLSTTQTDVELSIHNLFAINKALLELPFHTRLNVRPLDLRTPANLCIMRIQTAVGLPFREFLMKRDFVEIPTPKLVGGASESVPTASRSSTLTRTPCIAQRPQTYKQMAYAVAGLERVFGIESMIRAEKSSTHRHMSQFVDLDLEISIK